MKYTQKLGYISLGGVIAVVGMITTLLATTITAQTELPEIVDMILCKQLAIVSDDKKVVLYLRSGEHGGSLTVADNAGDPVVSLEVNENGGSVSVAIDKYTPAAVMSTNPHGGRVFVYGNHSSNEAYGSLEVGEKGAEIILTDNAQNITRELP